MTRVGHQNHHPKFSDGYIHIATGINIIDEKKKVHQKGKPRSKYSIKYLTSQIEINAYTIGRVNPRQYSTCRENPSK